MSDSKQLSLDEIKPVREQRTHLPGEPFDGETYEPGHDKARLVGQLEAVRELMKDHEWRTLAEIQKAIGGGSEAGISARLRDLRKEKHGSWLVHRRRRGDAVRGLFEYAIELPSGAS